MMQLPDAPGAACSLHTARLLLRPFRHDDIPAYAAIRAKPEVVRYLPGGVARALTARADAERLVATFTDAWRDGGYGPWAAVDRLTGTLLGHIGLRLLPELGGETEVLYMLDSAAWGRGLASEGAAAARDFASGTLQLPRLIGLALPENLASRRVLERIGMVWEGLVQAFGMELVRYVMVAPTP